MKGQSVYTIHDANGNEMSRKPASLTVRLSKLLKKEGDSGMKLIGEIKALTDKDKADLIKEFEAAGYPTTVGNH